MNENGDFNLQQLLSGNFTLYLDFDFDTILKLMIGLIIVGVLTSLITHKLIG